MAVSKSKSRVCVKELESGLAVEEIFLVGRKDVKTTKDGSLFLTLELRDRTGSVPAVMWRVPEELVDTFDADDYVRVHGRVGEYQKRPQLTLDSCIRMDPESVPAEEFLPCTEKDPEALFASVRETMATLKDPALKTLVGSFLDDANFAAAFKKAPAAVKLHHAFLGGLLEHVASALETGSLMAGHYPELNRDILLAGIFFHDIGKIRELACDRAFRYTDEGELVGHISLGVLMLDEKISGVPDFPALTKMLLYHIILSHHGEYEFGSPRLPMTAEAIAVHEIENLDAKLNSFKQITNDEQGADGNWSAWSKSLERRLFRGARSTAPEPAVKEAVKEQERKKKSESLFD